MLTKEEDFFSQVIVASELICRGEPCNIDVLRISKALTHQIKKSQEIRPGRHYGNYYHFSRFNRVKHRHWKRKKSQTAKQAGNVDIEEEEKNEQSAQMGLNNDLGRNNSDASDESSSCNSDEDANSELSDDSDSVSKNKNFSPFDEEQK